MQTNIPELGKRAWWFPMWLLGRAVVWLSRSPVRVERDGVQFAQARGFVAMFLRMGSFVAITVGDSILFLGPVPELDLPLVRHELTHVTQARRWGPAWPVAYAVGWCLGLVQAVRLGALSFHNAYRLNPFEVEARTRAKHNEGP